MSAQVTVVDHPLVQHKLSLARMKERSTAGFRDLVHEVSMLLAYEVTRDLKVTYEDIETPLAPMKAPVLDGKKVVLAAILRAGVGIAEGMLKLIPSARVGHIGMYRDEETLEAVSYYFKLPKNLSDRDVLVVDPMLATGHTAVAAIAKVKELKPRSLKYVCLLSAPEGIAHMEEHHPDVPIYTAAIDDHLNESGYILPGLGDAGDRLFGTR